MAPQSQQPVQCTVTGVCQFVSQSFGQKPWEHNAHSLVPRTIPSFSMLHAEKREGLAHKVVRGMLRHDVMWNDEK